MFRRLLEPFQQHFVFDGLDMECGVTPVQFFDLDVVEPVAESVMQECSGFGVYLIHVYPYRPVDVDG